MDSRLPCEPCKQRGIYSRASKYCTTCQESQCKDCAEVHKICKATRTHILVDIKNYQSSAKFSMDLQAARSCKEHTNKQTEFYCGSHRELLCTSCLLTNLKHRNCKTIVQLTSLALDAEDKPFTDKIFNDLTSTILSTKYTQMKLEETLKKSNDGVRHISDQLNNIRDRFIALFDEQKNNIVKNAEEMFSMQTDKCKNLLENMKKSQTAAEKCEVYLRELVNSGRGSDVFHCIMLAIDKIEDLKKQTNETCQHSTIININLEDSPFLKAIEERKLLIDCKLEEINADISNSQLDTTNTDEFYEHIITCYKERTNENLFETSSFKTVRRKSMDEFTIHTVTEVLPENEKIRIKLPCTDFGNTESTASAAIKADHVFQADSSVTRMRLPRSKSTSHLNLESTLPTNKAAKSPKHKITFIYSAKFNVSPVGCTDVWFGGIVCLPDDRIVLSDYLNKRLIILNNDHQMKDTIPLKYCPGYLSLLGDDLIIVCLMKTNQVLLLNIIGDVIEGEAYLQTRHHPKCAHSINGQKVLVSMKDGDNNWFMDILNNDGTIEQTIQLKEFYDGHKIAVQPIFDKGKLSVHIIQYCEISETLRCFKLDGNIVFSYDIDRVTCVLVDSKGFIFIVRHTGEVQVLSPEGRNVGHIHKMSMYKAKFSAFK